eukprot:scaffold9399_cov92-Amphora_coffeaeformis.AAC.1
MPAWNGCPWLPPMEVPTLLLPSKVLVALTDEISFHGHVGIELLPKKKVPSLLLPSTVLGALADEIIFHGHAGMEWLPSVAPNG